MNKLFEQIEGFNENEAWGDPSKVNGLAVMLLEKVRQWFINKYDEQVRVVLHCAYEVSGHSPDSQHSWRLRDHKSQFKGGVLCNAIDFHIGGLPPEITFNQQVSDMLECLGDLQVISAVGLGIYPTWNNQGFHLDVRGYYARWGFIDKKQVSLGEALAHATSMEENA